MARRRRRRWIAGVLVVLALLVGGGVYRHGGWFDAAGVPVPAGGGAEPGAPRSRPPAGGSEPGATDAVDAELRDRVFGAIARLRRDATAGALSAAFAVRDQLAIEPLAGDLATQRQACGPWLETALREQFAALVAAVRGGSILAAARRVADWIGDGAHPDVVRAVGEMCAARGWPPLLAGGPATGAGVAAPQPLPERQPVRIRFRDAWHVGVALAPSAGGRDPVTVRLETAEGVFFPEVPRAALEPETATPDLATDQVRAALRSGDRVLAAAWLAHCREHGVALPEDLRAAADRLAR